MTEPKPVVLPLHHDPIAMQKYELFLKLARVSQKKMRKKCIFGYSGAFSSEKSERFRRNFEIFRVVVEKECINDCATIVEEFDCISMIFQRHFYNLSMYLEGFSRVTHQGEKCAPAHTLIIYREKDWGNIGYLIFFL